MPTGYTGACVLIQEQQDSIAVYDSDDKYNACMQHSDCRALQAMPATMPYLQRISPPQSGPC